MVKQRVSAGGADDASRHNALFLGRDRDHVERAAVFKELLQAVCSTVVNRGGGAVTSRCLG